MDIYLLEVDGEADSFTSKIQKLNDNFEQKVT